MARLPKLTKTFQACWKNRSSRSEKQERITKIVILKINELLNKFLGALYSIGENPELKSDQILHRDKSIQTAIGKNQIRVHLIDLSINWSLEKI